MAAPSRGRAETKMPGGVFAHFAVRSLKLNRIRSVVSIAGITLSCALITAIFTSASTLYSGLLTAEVSREGEWQVEFVDPPRDDLEMIANDPRIDRIYQRVNYGSALMPKSFEGYWGRYLDICAWPTEADVAGLKPLPNIVEGRAPKAAGEIALTQDLKGLSVENGQWLYEELPTTGRDDDVPRVDWDGQLALGAQITLATGQRIYVDPETGQEAPCSYDDSTFTHSGPQGDFISEYLTDVEKPATYTVVGFYAPLNSRYMDVWGSSGGGYLGFVADRSLAMRSSSVYVSTNLNTRSDIDAFVDDYTADSPAWQEGAPSPGGAYTHESLLRYQGLLDDRSIWGTLYTLACILSSVVILASISLIYNSFAIAVSERTRQFGLLASLGASRRQLRRTVYTEALILAAIGIPLGMVVGIVGTYGAFAIAGEGLGALIDIEAFAGKTLPLTIDPRVLALAGVLTLLTVLVSALVPASRASRVSAVDAIRQARDVAHARGERSTRAGSATRPYPVARALDELRLRLFGVPGLLAHRNLTRAGGKGRVAVASLAVSVALIITSGAISHYTNALIGVAEGGASDIEVNLNRVLLEGETTADGIAAIDTSYRDLASVDGVTGRGYTLFTSAYAAFAPGMIDIDSLEDPSLTPQLPGVTVDDERSPIAPVSILFVDADSWDQIIAENKLDRDRFCDPERPLAVALNGTQISDGDSYLISDLFTGKGTLTLFTHIDIPKGSFFDEIREGESGEPVAAYEGYGEDGETRFDEDGNPIYRTIERPLDEAVLSTRELEVGAVTTTHPTPIKDYSSAWPTIVLPITALPALSTPTDAKMQEGTGHVGDALATPFFFRVTDDSYVSNPMSVYLCYDAEHPREAETALYKIFGEKMTGPEWHRVYLSNYAEEARTSRLMVNAIQLFIGCFIVITGSIAVANVFNTLTSSIILRRREFAMLKSTGMGTRSFLKMIALECLSYTWRGLAFGLAIGAIVTFCIYQAMAISFKGMGFTVALGWVGAAVGIVALVLVLSTAYALRISNAGSIVQTLREDAI